MLTKEGLPDDGFITRTVFPEVRVAHTAIFTEGFGFQGDGEIRNETVPARDVGDVHDDPPFAVVSLCWFCLSDFSIPQRIIPGSVRIHPYRHPNQGFSGLYRVSRYCMGWLYNSSGLYMDMRYFRSGTTSRPVATTEKPSSERLRVSVFHRTRQT